MIVLTGTSGHLGGGVLKNILAKKLLPTIELIVSAYNTDKVPESLKKAGILVRHGDFTKPETLRSSFKGADTLFLVTYPSPSEERFEHHKAAIDAAKEVGIRHVIYTSLSYGGESGLETVAGVMKAHVKSVKYLMTSGLGYTIVREAAYCEIWSMLAGFVELKPGNDPIDIIIPGDGPSTYASRDELGEATAEVVANWRDYKNQSVLLTGPRATTVREIATLLEKHTGRKVNFSIVSPEEAIAYQRKKGTFSKDQDWYLDNWVTWFKALENGECNFVDLTMEKLLGRKPRGIEEMADELFAPKSDSNNY